MKYKLILFLLLAPSFFAELVFPNTPVTTYVQPAQFLLFMLVYGVPALLIYDAWVRYKLSWGGLFLLSLFYAFYIEGIIMKTFLLGYTPEPSFAHYGVVFGIAVPWAVSMMISHGVISMLFPNILARYYFGDTSSPYVLTRWVRILLLFVVAALGVLTYFFSAPTHPDTIYFLIFAALLILAVSAARRYFSDAAIAYFPLRPVTGTLVPPVLFGMLSFVLFFFLTRSLAQNAVYPALGVLLMIFFVALGAGVIRLRGWLASTAMVACVIGLYVGSALLGIFITLPQGRFDSAIVSSLALVGLLYLLSRIKNKSVVT